MEWDEFVAIRKEIMASHPPVTGGNLSGMMADFHHMFGESGLLSGATINKSGNLEGIIAVRYRICSSLLDISSIKDELEWIWTEDLSYRYYEAHCFRTEETSVTLDCITMPSAEGYYVTASIIIELQRA